MWSIYKHTNLITNQVYIGITNQNPEDRWGKNGKGYSQQPKFFNAILEYGWRNFKHEILFNNIQSEIEARQLETNLIQQYDAIENGYNDIISYNHKDMPHNKITQYIDINTNKIYSSMKDIAKELKVSPSTISYYFSRGQQLCQGHLLMDKDIYDSLSYEEQQRLKNSITQKVMCIETNEIFNSPEEAGKKYSDKKGAKAYILQACRNNTTAYKKHWKFI